MILKYFLCAHLTSTAARTGCLAIKVIVGIIIITDTRALSPCCNNLATLKGGLFPLYYIIRGILEIQSCLKRS